MHSTIAAFTVNTYSYSLSHSAMACAGELAGLGFRDLELMVYPGHLWPDDLNTSERRQLRQALEAAGMRVVTLNMPNIDINLAAASPAMRAYSLDLLTSAIELAGELGVPDVIVGPGKANPLLPMPLAQLEGHFFSALDRLTKVAAKAGISLLSENMPFAFLPGMKELVAALDAYGDKTIGIVFDAANSHFIGQDAAIELAACADRLRVVHVSDTDQATYRHAPVGDGTVDFSAIPAHLARLGLTPRLTLEIVCANPGAEMPRSAGRLSECGWSNEA